MCHGKTRVFEADDMHMFQILGFNENSVSERVHESSGRDDDLSAGKYGTRKI